MSLPKPGALTLAERGWVYKVFPDPRTVDGRLGRARGMLSGLVPRPERLGLHAYRYRRIPGRELSRAAGPRRFEAFLRFCSRRLWKPLALTGARRERFRRSCLAFYRDKTLARVRAFHRTAGLGERAWTINGARFPAASALLARVDWGRLARGGIPAPIHGDLAANNVIVRPDGGFALVDWREDFAGLDHGDVYYDLAKLDHSLRVSIDAAREGRFRVSCGAGRASYQFPADPSLLRLARILDAFLDASGYDRGAVRLLSALVYLNSAALHEVPYGRLLYFHGLRSLAGALSRGA